MYTRLVPQALMSILLASSALAQLPKGEEKAAPATEDELKASRENLKAIGAALAKYHDAAHVFPNNIESGGKVCLSWRVQLLPFLGEEDLHKQFKLDEPWDGETNKKLVEKMPKVYAPVRVKTKEKGLTFYQGFVGRDTAFELGQRLPRKAFSDGLANTVGVVEAGEPVVWTKPVDLPFDPNQPLPKLGGLFDGDLHVLFMNGKVDKADGKKMNADQFKLIITRSDGRVMLIDDALGK